MAMSKMDDHIEADFEDEEIESAVEVQEEPNCGQTKTETAKTDKQLKESW